MKIDQVVELPDGAVKVSGTLDAEALRVVLEAGLALLIASGSLAQTPTHTVGTTLQ